MLDKDFITWFNKLPLGFIIYMHTNYLMTQMAAQQLNPITDAEIAEFDKLIHTSKY